MRCEVDPRGHLYSYFSPEERVPVQHPLRTIKAHANAGRRLQLLSDEHFSVDGTLIEAWASAKAYQRKDGGGSGPDAGRAIYHYRKRNLFWCSDKTPRTLNTCS